jgi:LysM repeat protein
VRSTPAHERNSRKPGRHRKPSPTATVARRAGRAAPVLAVSGALAAGPQVLNAAHAFAATSPAPHTVSAVPEAYRARTAAAHLDASVQPASQAQTYTVQTGNTLFGIAQQFLGSGNDWPQVFHENSSKISDPDLIYPGQVLDVAQQAASSSTDPSSQGSSSQQSATQPSSSQQSQSSSAGSSGTVSSSVQQDIANGNNLLAVAEYLKQNGYSDAAAAGVASCVDGESGGNPESVGSGGGGLIGWTPISSAAPNANIITGNVEQDMTTQLADLLYYNSTEIGQSLVSQLNSQADPVAAADFYSQNFEKPAVTDSDVVQSVAEQIFSELGG